MFVFLITIYPAKVMLGWAYHRASNGRQAWRPWSWLGSCAALAGVATYVVLLYLVQTSGLLGNRVVWQHHALLLPLPWWG
jgi:hypothetical protein